MAKKVKETKEGKGAKGLPSDRAKKIQDILGPIRKQFGEESVMYGDQEIKEMEVISTGSLRLNKALGVGGIPRGRIIEIYGPESSGKTTITLHLVAEAQKKGLLCAFIDAEHAMDAKYAEKLGCNTREWIFAQPDSGEQGLEILDALVKSNEVGLVIVDSVAALTPKAELEGDMGASHMGLQARLMSQALRKLTAGISKSNCTVVFINQIRSKIGVMFGSPETTTGGNALKFYASIRLNIRAGEKIKKKDANGDEQVVGGEMVVKVVKNKVAPPFTEAKVPVTYGEGFNLGGEVYMRAVEKEFLEKGGGTHYFEGVKVAGSKEEALNKLNSKSPTFDKDLFDKLYKMVLTSYETDEVEEDETPVSEEE